MLNANIMLDHEPERIKVELLPEGIRRIALYDNIRAEQIEEGGKLYTAYRADEVAFISHEELTPESVAEDFGDWWTFGTENDSDEGPVSIEERLSAVEERLAEMAMGG